ncbi:MAG: hypothetical protein CSA55_03940 [Ilumatobacter coccineus]|uniref:Cell shape-determining protein MreC n=1 Tax=Ilumatobacter coccineus TaxID=467094 RepID=A0A2G6K988_9ACTN|nr:MAG: hypothetical protein CSA55_03940 [Ilumatobacter coccineus]
MAVYSPGRRRTIALLLLTSLLLVTLDLRGNSALNSVRSVFGYVSAPFETAGRVVSRPFIRVWRGITMVDDLEAENRALRQEIDRQRSDQIAGQNAMIENRQLRDALGIESLADYEKVAGEIIGQLPSNIYQRVEIDVGANNGVKVGMPVINEAGLVGKITFVAPTTSIVMLVTDPQYHVPVKVVGTGEPVTDDSTPPTVPSGLPVDDVTIPPTTTTLPPAESSVPSSVPAPSTSSPAQDGDTTAGITTTTTTTTTIPAEDGDTRETGDLGGAGADRLPRIRFITDSRQFGKVQEGDAVLTTGGSLSLAPPGIPVGTVEHIISRSGSAGLELEVRLSADLSRLSFLTVVLYQPSTELGGR